MTCQNCGADIRISKSLGMSKSEGRPKECPDCGEVLKEDSRLEKGV